MSLPISAQGLPAYGVACPPSVWWVYPPFVWWAVFGKVHPFLMSAFSFDLSSVLCHLVHSDFSFEPFSVNYLSHTELAEVAELSGTLVGFEGYCKREQRTSQHSTKFFIVTELSGSKAQRGKARSQGGGVMVIEFCCCRPLISRSCCRLPSVVRY